LIIFTQTICLPPLLELETLKTSQYNLILVISKMLRNVFYMIDNTQYIFCDNSVNS